MKKNNLIPFRWLPASWGLVGKAFDEAEAYYNYEGETLERRLVDIRFTGEDDEHTKEMLKLDLKYNKISDYDFEVEMAQVEYPDARAKALLDIDKKFGKISDYDYDCAIAELDHPDGIPTQVQLDIQLKYDKISEYEHDLAIVNLVYTEENLDKELALLTVDYNHEKITKLEFEKTVASARNEPWVGIVDNGFNPEQGVNGVYFEFDWNNQWIEFLRKNGYNGLSEDEIVEQWFSDVCRSQAEENPIDNGPAPFTIRR